MVSGRRWKTLGTAEAADPVLPVNRDYRDLAPACMHTVGYGTYDLYDLGESDQEIQRRDQVRN